MARKLPPARPKDFHEPLWARRSMDSWAESPPKIPANCDPEVAAKILAEFEDCVRNPAWVVWGTALFDPTASLAPENPAGEPVPGGGTICKISHCQAFARDTATPEHMAKRIAVCVNAMRGITNPEDLLEDLRRLLERITSDESFDYAATASELLGRMQKPVPPTEAIEC